jgi:hypothetical protein
MDVGSVDGQRSLAKVAGVIDVALALAVPSAVTYVVDAEN